MTLRAVLCCVKVSMLNQRITKNCKLTKYSNTNEHTNIYKRQVEYTCGAGVRRKY